jgi:hypothetical protein
MKAYIYQQNDFDLLGDYKPIVNGSSLNALQIDNEGWANGRNTIKRPG